MSQNKEVVLKTTLSSSEINKNDIAKIQQKADKCPVSLTSTLDTSALFDTLKKIAPKLEQALSKATGITLKIQDEDINTVIKQLSTNPVSSAILESIGPALTELKDVNTLLTEISKTNATLSKSEVEQLGNDAFEIAGKYGKKASDYLNAEQALSMAGYADAKGIAELSVAAQCAGNLTAELANQYMTATDKAYGMNGSVEALRTMLDGTNKITSENSINMAELAEGMTVVGSTAANSKVTVEQTTAALGTLISKTQESGSEIGNAFSAVLMNLQQVTGEVADGGNAIDETSLTNYKNACEQLGVSLYTIKDGAVSLKEPMQILKDLSVAYNSLNENDTKRTYLLSSMGGNSRANALDALLTNFDLYEKMLQDYANGEGSIAAKAELTAASWEGAMNRLSNTWTDTIGNVANSDGIVTGVNALNRFLDIVNQITSAIGGIPLLIGAMGTAALSNKGLD